jgi:superoxide reductase
MEKLNEKSVELGHEKHLPVIETTQNGVILRVGEALHPMTVEHHIVWIELLTDFKAYRIDLPLDSEPVVEICTHKEPVAMVRAYCNVHGLWGKE